MTNLRNTQRVWRSSVALADKIMNIVSDAAVTETDPRHAIAEVLAEILDEQRHVIAELLAKQAASNLTKP